MNQNRDYLQDISSIRTAMERSVKFLSLSGLSGVLAGMYALAGAAMAWYVLASPHSATEHPHPDNPQPVGQLLLIAAVVLVLSLLTGYFLSLQKSKRLGVSVWNKTSRDFLSSLFIPLSAGGLFIVILIYHQYFALAAPASLIFYGLALLNASFFTVREIRYLGFSEIVMGLFAALWPHLALLLWAAGFGLLHIIYGLVVHYRYDREKSL